MLVVSTDDNKKSCGDDLGWKTFVSGGFSSHQVPTTHLQIISKQFVGQVAMAINSFLN
jgi:hypothetical protein